MHVGTVGDFGTWINRYPGPEIVVTSSGCWCFQVVVGGAAKSLRAARKNNFS